MDRGTVSVAAVALVALIQVIEWHYVLCLVGAVAGPVQNTRYRPNGSLCDIFVQPQGYACDELRAQTSDGFILGVQRMYSGTLNGTAGIPKKPVFLYHGLLSGGESWLLNDRANCLPFLLADAGYDVWIGNTRTTDFSHGHVFATRTDKQFWDWSTDDLVAHDLPTMLNLVHSSTNQTAHYIGFSQGTQVAVAGLIEGHLQSMMDRVVLLAPVARVDSLSSALGVAASLSLVDEIMLLAGIWEFNADLASGQKLLDMICGHAEAHCDGDFISAFTGPNCCLNDSRRDYYEQFETQSTATKNLAHFAQQYRTNSFSKYDYGFWGNLVRYRSFSPPEYDLRKFPQVPLLLIHGGNDGLADKEDVELFVQSLTFSPQVLYFPDYGHLDFAVSYRANSDVYHKILDFLSPSTA
ncbi:hypothetical protein R1flu_018115 [Riccia fluitans]|uniref:Lipase n=1 Tax=Riccia fluitans TaxID=41844 RepID=A0ABD1ZFY5_9MARC